MKKKKNPVLRSRRILFLALLAFPVYQVSAQRFTTYTSTQEAYQQKSKCVTSNKALNAILLKVQKPSVEEQWAMEQSGNLPFKAWGTCMNELDWDALQLLSEAHRNQILDLLYLPDKGLGYTMGRITMNANDYSRNWYSCDSVDGDFQLRYFNINRDREATIPFITAAQARCPDMTFWMSPWSPPAWMKINHHYAVQSSKYNDLSPQKDHLLFGDADRSDNEQVKPDRRFFPRRLATQDFFIQEPRYLQTYANMFCKFIQEYQKEGIPISMVMYQNEAYSYTAYPGCPWTVEGIQRFNLEYLAPTLQQQFPQVKLCLGTFNTNRYQHVVDLLKDPRWSQTIVGLGFQWEGRQIIQRIREQFPQYQVMSTESECGNGRFDWPGAHHTFYLITDYLGLGCRHYTFWNAVLKDNGQSPWGWRQNALVQVNSQTNTYTLSPEYYAVWHYTHFLRPGARILAYQSSTPEQPCNVLVALSNQGKWLVFTNNHTDVPQQVTLQLGKRYLNLQVQAQSISTYVEQ